MGAQKSVRLRVKRETRTERIVGWLRTFGKVMTLK
jgi:hypothetical protein